MATNAVYTKEGTSTTWTDSGGDKLMDLGSLAADGRVMGAYLDLGATPRPERYKFELTIDGFDSDPVIGESVDLYFSTSDNTTNFDGNPDTDPTASVEGSITVNQLKNCKYAKSAIVYVGTAASELKVSGEVTLLNRYVSPVIHNNTVDALLGTADSHTLILTPIYPDVQAAA